MSDSEPDTPAAPGGKHFPLCKELIAALEARRLEVIAVLGDRAGRLADYLLSFVKEHEPTLFAAEDRRFADASKDFGTALVNWRKAAISRARKAKELAPPEVKPPKALVTGRQASGYKAFQTAANASALRPTLLRSNRPGIDSYLGRKYADGADKGVEPPEEPWHALATGLTTLPKAANVALRSPVIGAWWKSLSDEQREPFVAVAEEAKSAMTADVPIGPVQLRHKAQLLSQQIEKSVRPIVR